jgi:hypothetical protein
LKIQNAKATPKEAKTIVEKKRSCCEISVHVDEIRKKKEGKETETDN